jgi:hypothetical protein
MTNSKVVFFSRPVQLFSRRIKAFWVIVNLLLSAAETISRGPMPDPVYYLYYTSKVAAFFLLGFLSPLAFQRLNGIAVGVLSCLTGAVIVESSQILFHNGHSFHWHELAGKIALITLGFAVGLERRYQRQMSIGPLAIQLAAK